MASRCRAGARLLLSHATIERRDHVAGGAHRAIFYGFMVLFAGTLVLGFDTDFTSPVFGWSYFHGNFYLIYKEVLNLFGTALIYTGHIDLRHSEWLGISIILFAIAFFFALFVQLPNSGKMVDAIAAMPPGPPPDGGPPAFSCCNWARNSFS